MYYDHGGYDGYDSDPAKYHYLESAPMRRSRRAMYDDSVYAPSLSRRDSLYDQDIYSDPYSRRPRRRSQTFSRAGSIRPSTASYYDAPGQAADYYDSLASDYYAGSGRPSSSYYDGVLSAAPSVVVVPNDRPIPVAPVMRGMTSATLASESPDSVVLSVPICCDGCERRITEKLLRVPGVMSVWCDVPTQQVRVRGYFDTDEVLRKARRAFRSARLW